MHRFSMSTVPSRHPAFRWLIPVVCLLILSACAAGVASADEPQSGLLFWNRLGSDAEVLNSEVGPGGTRTGGTFVEGVFGDAFRVAYNEQIKLEFPKDVIHGPAGCVEFWARLDSFPGTLSSGENPALVKLYDGSVEYSLHLNGQ